MIARALTNTGWLMGARGVNAVLSLIYLALATRSLGLAGFGQFILVVTFAQLVVGLASFQSWQAIIHWGQSAQERSQATGFALALDGLSIGIGAIAATLVLAFAGNWLPIPHELRPAAFAFTLVMLLAIRSTPTGLLRLHDRYARAASADATTSIVRVLGAAVVAAASPSITGFLIVWGLAELATAAMYWGLAVRTEPVAWRSVSLRRLPRAHKGAWRFVAGTSLSGSLAVSRGQLLILLVGAFGGAPLAGIYRVGAQIGEGLLRLAQALLRATYPELKRDPESARAIASRISLIAIGTGIATLAVALVAGEWVILTIAGAAFLAAYWPMIALSAAAAVELAGAALEALLLARGRAATNFMLRAVPTALALLALPWLIEWRGATGVALAVLGASVLTVAGVLVATVRGATKEPAVADTPRD